MREDEGVSVSGEEEEEGESEVSGREVGGCWSNLSVILVVDFDADVRMQSEVGREILKIL